MEDAVYAVATRTWRMPVAQKDWAAFRFRIRIATEWLPVAAVRHLYTNRAQPFCRLCEAYFIEDTEHLIMCSGLSFLSLLGSDSLTEFFADTATRDLATDILFTIAERPEIRLLAAGIFPAWVWRLVSSNSTHLHRFDQ
jgi:hypothetical protein